MIKLRKNTQLKQKTRVEMHKLAHILCNVHKSVFVVLKINGEKLLNYWDIPANIIYMEHNHLNNV